MKNIKDIFPSIGDESSVESVLLTGILEKMAKWFVENPDKLLDALREYPDVTNYIRANI